MNRAGNRSATRPVLNLPPFKQQEDLTGFSDQNLPEVTEITEIASEITTSGDRDATLHHVYDHRLATKLRNSIRNNSNSHFLDFRENRDSPENIRFNRGVAGSSSSNSNSVSTRSSAEIVPNKSRIPVKIGKSQIPPVVKPIRRPKEPLPNQKSTPKKQQLPQDPASSKTPSEIDDKDPARVSRLFYLQLYSSVLNANETETDGNNNTSVKNRSPKSASETKLKSSLKRPKKLLASLPKFAEEVTSTLMRKVHGQSRENEKIQHHDHPTLQRNLSEDFERDAGSSLQETVVVETMDPNHNHNHHNPRTLGFGTLGSGAQTRTPVPVLNTRMKNLSQFSFRYRESDREQRVRVVQTTSRSCHAKKTVCSSLFIALASLASILVLTLVLSAPSGFTSFYEVVYLPDARPEIRPRIAFCLPMPFEHGKLRSLGVSSELASFLLYTLSPYYPNPDILDNPELLTDLTAQYRRFATRIRARVRSRLSPNSLNSGGLGLKGLLKTVAPTCQELVVSCQTGSGAIVRGEQCCGLLFKDGPEFGPDGLCLVGGGRELELLASEPRFPIAPRPFSLARLTIVLNMTSKVPVDHRVVPWEPANSNVISASVIKSGEAPAFRDVRQDFVVRPGHTVAVTTSKKQILRSGGGRVWGTGGCRSSLEDKDYSFAACQSSVVQLIAEKSVNCSMVSLPRENKGLPLCGPLEGLALMYILREQGALVTVNSTMLNRFESTLTDHCPQECQTQHFQPEVTSDAYIDRKTASQFGARRAEDIAIVEMRYAYEKQVETRRHMSALLVLFERIGSVSGVVISITLILYAGQRIFRKRRRMLFKR